MEKVIPIVISIDKLARESETVLVVWLRLKMEFYLWGMKVKTTDKIKRLHCEDMSTKTFRQLLWFRDYCPCEFAVLV